MTIQNWAQHLRPLSSMTATTAGLPCWSVPTARVRGDFIGVAVSIAGVVRLAAAVVFRGSDLSCLATEWRFRSQAYVNSSRPISHLFPLSLPSIVCSIQYCRKSIDIPSHSPLYRPPTQAASAFRAVAGSNIFRRLLHHHPPSSGVYLGWTPKVRIAWKLTNRVMTGQTGEITGVGSF